MKLLYIQASPRVMRSHSKAIADAFVEAWKKFNNGSKVDIHDLWDMDLPDFHGLAVEARYLVGSGKNATDEHKEAWEKVAKFADNFISYDRFVIACPMWNFSLPYKMKHYLDLVVQPRITFQRTDEYYKEDVAKKKVALFLARAGQYPEGSPIDFQKPYLNHILKMMGLVDTHYILVEPTGADPKLVKDMHTAKINEALALSKTF